MSLIQERRRALARTERKAAKRPAPQVAKRARKVVGIAPNGEAAPDPAAEFERNDDLLWGASRCAAYLQIPLSKFYYLFNASMLPGVRKIGHKTIVASKRKLDRLADGPGA
jgi:hypothetical protein